MDELVSVIIPTFNRAGLLPQTIKSVLKQTYKRIEILIVDDGSTDDTREVVASFSDERIRYFRIDHFGYPAPARNKGLSEARGNFIAMLDSDDLWFPRELSTQMKVFESNPSLFLVGTNIVNYPIPSGPVLKLKRDTIVSFREIFSINCIITSSVLFKKSIVQEIGLLDDRRRVKSVEDFDYWLRLLHAHDKSVLILKQVLTAYRIHENNISQISQTVGPLKELQHIVHVYAKYNDLYPELVRRIIASRLDFIHYALVKKRIVEHQMSLSAFLGPATLSLKYKVEGLLLYLSGMLVRVFAGFLEKNPPDSYHLDVNAAPLGGTSKLFFPYLPK